MTHLKNRLIRFFLSLGTGLVLAACASQSLPPGGATQESMITACRAYDDALVQLSSVSLTAPEIGEVNTIRALINPICTDPNSYQLPGLLQNVQVETTRILTLYKNKGGKP